jgi:hypothetical protein
MLQSLKYAYKNRSISKSVPEEQKLTGKKLLKSFVLKKFSVLLQSDLLSREEKRVLNC